MSETLELSTKQIQKYNKRSLPYLIKLAEKYFNTYIRQRDQENGFFTCISCQHTKSIEQMNAGHYLSAGNHSAVRFDQRNVHGQCIKCNNFLSGNLLPYRVNLIKKIGEDQVQLIEMIGKLPFKWDRFEVIAIIIKYQNLLSSKN